MTIKIGERVPAGTFKVMSEKGPTDLSSAELFGGKRVLLFAVPGAFTPTCDARHLPGYIEHFEALRAKGIDTVACLSVNDVFVMNAWAKAGNAVGKVVMLADGNGEYARALGLELDARGFGMGQRVQRFAMVVEDGVVKELNIEPSGQYGVSSAEAMLERR